MQDIIENLSNNNSVIIGLSIIVGVLVLLFFFILLSGKKNKKEETSIDENIEPINEANDLDFNHDEYVKETTAEFELTPIEDIKPAIDEYVPDIKEEETPALNINSESEELPLADFSFDELSKSIALELDKLKEEKKSIPKEETEASSKNNENDVINPFNDDSIFKPYKVSKIEDMITEEEKEEKPTFKVTEDIFKKNDAAEPVLKEENVPLFARFNQETYDITDKD